MASYDSPDNPMARELPSRKQITLLIVALAALIAALMVGAWTLNRAFPPPPAYPQPCEQRTIQVYP